MSDVFYSSMELLAKEQSAGHKQLKKEIIDMRSALKREMDKGLTPVHMETARALTEAVDAADVAIDKMYMKLCR